MRTLAAIAGVLVVVWAGLAFALGLASAAWIGLGLAAAYVCIAAALIVLVFRPMARVLASSRQRLAGKHGSDQTRNADHLAELSSLLETLIDVSNAGDALHDADAHDLVRLRAHNEQLLEVGDIGQEVNAALPYRETVDRALSRTKSFLRADLVTLLRLDPATQGMEIEGMLGVRSRSLDPSCCREQADCPLRRSMRSEAPLHSSDHACTLFPRTMRHQISVPFAADGAGQMALLATSTTDDRFGIVSDEALRALGGHLRSAVSNARKYDSIRRQVVTDHLTRLYNRRYFVNRSQEELERSLREQAPMSIVMVDIDHFKHFNDSYGHATGDRVLQAVAAILQEAVRTTDTCARHGGEEFTLLLPNTPGENAVFLAERVRRTLGGTRYTGLGLPADANVTISAGIATCPRDATTVEELLELADRALYRAKAEGRDRVVLYEAEHTTQAGVAVGGGR